MSTPPWVSADAAEKGINELLDNSSKQIGQTAKKISPNFFTRLNARITSISFLDERGIQRVPEDECYAPSLLGYILMTLLWFSINLTAKNVALGLLGPLVYGLGFTELALCAVVGGLLVSAGAATMSTWGPVSGNRIMVVAR